MTREELNYIKDAFSQIIDDIAGNPDWHEAARAVASDLGTLERKLEEKVSSLPSNLDEAAEESLEKEQPQGLDKPRTIGKGIHKQEYTGCDMSWMDEWKYASKGLDEAAEEYADIQNKNFLKPEIVKNIFKAGAKWMAEQGVTKEAVIGMATKDIEINVSGRVLDELELGPGDKVIVQIRKK